MLEVYDMEFKIRWESSIIHSLYDHTQEMTMRAEQRLRLPPNSRQTPAYRQNFGEEKQATTETTKTAISQIPTPPDLRCPPPRRAINPKTNENSPYARPTVGKCFRCNQSGHRSNQCPTRKPIHIVDTFQDDEEDEPNNEDLNFDADDVCGNESHELVCIVQRTLCSPKQEEPTQRRKIFQAKYRIGQAVCSLIIESCSCEI